MRKVDIGFVIILVFLLIERFVSGYYSDPKEAVLSMLIMLPGMLIGLTFHEFAHAMVSYKLGDPTPKAQGRVSLNPLAHIDWAGFLALLICGFGWGRAVEINPMYYKKRRRDELLVSLAGVITNLILAVLFSLLLKVLMLTNMASSSAGGLVLQMVTYAVTINLVLMIFNLIPVPPLDGFGIITEIFNLRRFKWFIPLYNSGTLILMLLIVFGITDRILSPAVNGIWNLLLTYIIY